MRQTQQRQVGVKLRHVDRPGLAELGNARQRGKQRHQVGPADQDEFPTALGRQRQVARELDGVAGALFGMDEQGLSGIGTPVPSGMRALEGRKLPGLPAPLVLGKAARVVAQLQQGQAQVEVRLGIVGLQRNGALVGGHGLRGLAQATIAVAQTVVGLGPLGLGLNHLL